jgi:hypothetical protein
MLHRFNVFTSAMAVAIAMLGIAAADAAFTPIVIRESAGNPPDILINNDYVPGATEFVIEAAGQKAAWASNDVNGYQIGDITNLSVTRHDDTTRFALGSGPAVGPYLNIWVTDGMGKYAVLANEPSDGVFQPLFVDNGDGSKSYNLSFADLADKPVKVFETVNGGGASTTTWVHDLFGNNPLTFGDVAGLTIEAPSAAYISNPANFVGGGAPREIGTLDAYGVNWVFGDSLANYVSGMEGYVVSNPSATAVPEPGALAIVALAAMGVVGFARRRR